MKKLLLALLAVLTFSLVGCQETQQGSKCVTIEVVYAEEELNETMDVCTDAEYMLGLLEENADELGVETTDSDFGVYLSGLKGYNFETLGMNYYWSIFINGEYGMLGISDQPVLDGDVYKFEAASF